MRRKLLVLILFTPMIYGCDAVLFMRYSVQNTSKNDVTLHIPNYPLNPEEYDFSKTVDTVLILQPKETILVGTGSKIDFPWAQKNIYRNQPGMCGIKQLEADSTIHLGCTRHEWKYRKGRSILKIR